MLLSISTYISLFVASFLAATLLPMQSELFLAALLAAKKEPIFALITVATIGNVAGSLANWFLGRFIERFSHKKWFPVKEAQLKKAENFYQRYGRFSLLLSWMPVIGDPLTLIAGVLKEPLSSFLLFVTLAKLGRYIVVAAITLSLF